MGQRIKKILIANRGEIAVRIAKTAKAMGISVVAVCSEADRSAWYTRMASEKVVLPGNDLSETFLNVEKIVGAALQTGCDALHPGYGFLAENPALVKACEAAGIIFIGPPAGVMELMGNKIVARNFMKEIGVPVIEGIHGTLSEITAKAGTLSYPVLIKAAAGGGGKGMRRVNNQNELKEALLATAREAKSYFNDDSVYVEKYLEAPRHIEIQILGDKKGNFIHLFERECSIQRRHQKIIEEAPSPAVSDELRASMTALALRIGKASGYYNAGTIEFMVDAAGHAFFLEMNTRIQVEHAVTEWITGIDMVEQQILIAAGQELSLKQDDIRINGHAIECRIYAEDPEKDFMPSPGKMSLYREPEGAGIRVDSSYHSPAEIFSFYDPMISKLVVHAQDRERAIERMILALHDFHIHGVATNIAYLAQVVGSEMFRKNQINTGFCQDYATELLDGITETRDLVPDYLPLITYVLLQSGLNDRGKTVWQQIGYWRILPQTEWRFSEISKPVILIKEPNHHIRIKFGDESYRIDRLNINEQTIRFRLENEKEVLAFYSFTGSRDAIIEIEHHPFKVSEAYRLQPRHEPSPKYQGDGQNHTMILSPMHGRVIRIHSKPDQKISEGDPLIIIESMKMENAITSPREGVIDSILVTEGEQVELNRILIKFKE